MAKSLVTDLIGAKIEFDAWVKETGRRTHEPPTALWCQIIRHLDDVGTIRAAYADKDGALILAARFGDDLVSGLPSSMIVFAKAE